jgi:hypothetical protein
MTQQFEFNTFRATVNTATTTVDGSDVAYYDVALEYHNKRVHELMEYKSYYEIAQSVDLEQFLAKINTQAELVMMMDEYSRNLGSSPYDTVGVSEDNYLDVAVRILERFYLK